MKRLFLSFLFVLSLLDSSAQRVLTFAVKPNATAQYAKVYILGYGQSNLSGQATSVGIDAQYTSALNAYIYSTYGSGTNTRNATTQSWQRLELNKNNNNEGVNGVAALNLFGPEIAFGKEMSDDFPDKIFILKCAYSSSTMMGQGSTNDWKIGGPGTNYQNLIQNTVINGLNEIISDFGLIPDIRGMIVLQGESERIGASGYSNASNLQSGYTLQASRVIAQAIDDIVEAGYDTKNMRIAVVRIHNSFPAGSTDAASLAAIRAAHDDLGANLGGTILPGYDRFIAGSVRIDTDALGRNLDDIHYNQSGQITLGGTSLYNYFSPYVNETVTITPASTTGFDADAASAVSAMGITNQTHANAINTLVVNAKAHSWWTPAVGMYSLLGGNRRSNKVNLKDPSNVNGYALTFNTSVKHTSAGFDGYIDGGYSTTLTGAGYADTHIPMTTLGQNTAGFFYHTPTNIQEAQYGMGVLASGNASRLYLPARWTDNNIYGSNMSSESTISTGNTDGSGTYGSTRTSSSNYNVFAKGTKTAVSSTSQTPDANTFTIGARNVNGAKSGFSIKTWDFFVFFNASISDATAALIKSDIETFETSVR